MTRVAAIDCGTNTIRLLIADAHLEAGGVRLETLERRNEIVRLGQGVDRTGRLDDAALERTLAVVEDYAAQCERHGVPQGPGHRRFVATSATRDAENREAFTTGVSRLLGIAPEVISGDEEARLAFAGSLLGSAAPQAPRLVVDLGGGSTELVLGAGAPSAAISLDVGSVRITERHLAHGVTAGGEEAARAEVRGLLEEAAQVVDLGAPELIVGMAGTITTVTSHALGLEAFDPQAVDGAELGVEQVLASCEAIIHSTPAQREGWGFLSPGRRDVIAAGALVWSEIVARVAADTAAAGRSLRGTVTSLRDILDGVALSLVPVEAAAPSSPQSAGSTESSGAGAAPLDGAGSGPAVR
ncbi:Ppx/GppA phosphatase family protein [Actinomyces capricornis]|uniref:Exopolyphosphatase n=1 Tax=Actinomyces capricornis TaxID=2755559 RepID=A0ABM7UF09_9ACTO|nr:exopolyphosphatase [Actinomyces capricornis]BDA63911.1 exopolyphosphatase [Actinomyces capricornis]